MNETELYRQFKNLGRDLFLSGALAARSGNMSQKRSDGALTITRSGAMLSDLSESDLITVSLQNDAPAINASSEVEIHRAIINNKSGKEAVVHAHCPYTIALANVYGEVFADNECLSCFGPPLLLGDQDKFIVGGYKDQIAGALSNHVVAVVAGHGVFAAAQTLLEAYIYLTALEASSKLVYLQKTLQ